MDYTREEIEEMCPEWVILVIIPKRRKKKRSNNDRIEANRQIMDTHIYLDKERF